jgi:hypothetical protein
MPICTTSEVPAALESVVIIDDDSDDDVKKKKDTTVVDLTAEDDDDCIMQSLSKNVISVPGHLPPNLTLFRGPANKVLIPVATPEFPRPARTSFIGANRYVQL